jgi:hypothetical protein
MVPQKIDFRLEAKRGIVESTFDPIGPTGSFAPGVDFGRAVQPRENASDATQEVHPGIAGKVLFIAPSASSELATGYFGTGRAPP